MLFIGLMIGALCVIILIVVGIVMMMKKKKNEDENAVEIIGTDVNYMNDSKGETVNILEPHKKPHKKK